MVLRTRGQSEHPSEDWEVLSRSCGVGMSMEGITWLEKLVHEGAAMAENWKTKISLCIAKRST